MIPEFYSASTFLHQQLKRRITVLKRSGYPCIWVKAPENAGINEFLATFARAYNSETVLAWPESEIVGGHSQISQIADKTGVSAQWPADADTGNPVLLASMKQAFFNELLDAMQQKGIGILIAPGLDRADHLFREFVEFLTVSWKYADVMKPGSINGPVVVTTGQNPDKSAIFRLKPPTASEIKKFLQPLVNTEIFNQEVTKPDLGLVNRVRLSMQSVIWQTTARIDMAKKLRAAGHILNAPFGIDFAVRLLGVDTKEAVRVIRVGMSTGMIGPVHRDWRAMPAKNTDPKVNVTNLLADMIRENGSPAAWKALWGISEKKATTLADEFLDAAFLNGYGREAIELMKKHGLQPDKGLENRVNGFLDEDIGPDVSPEAAFEIHILRGDLKKAAMLARSSKSPLLIAWQQYEERDLDGCLNTLGHAKPGPNVHLLRANCLMRMGDFDAAEAEALRVDTTDRIQMSRVDTTLGIIALRTGLYTRAAGKFQNALVQTESMGLCFASALLRDNLAITYEYMGKYAASMTQLTDAIIRYSRSGFETHVASGLVFMADLYTFMGEPMAAIKTLEKADKIIESMGLQREAVHAQAKRGEALAEAGRLPEGCDLLIDAGVKFLEKSLRVEAEQAFSRGMLYQVISGLEPSQMPDDVTDPEAQAIGWLAMGILHARQGQYVHAETLLTRAMDLLEQRRAWYFQAWALWETANLINEQETARQYRDQAKELVLRIADQLPEGFRDAFMNRRLPKTISEHQKTEKTMARPAKKDHKAIKAFEGMVGSSESFTRAINIAHRMAKTSLPVLITGESGTGKELIAGMIHRLSDRRDGPFVTINAAAVPEGVLAGELFGYEKGAFTGAERRRIGNFEAASHGTLFLDEIGDISPNLQKHLLRVLENNRIQRLGSNESIPVDARIIFATNRDLNTMVKRGEFRLDLFHRIAGLTVHMPAMRERQDDIPALIDFLCRELEPVVGHPVELTPKAVEVLKAYAFPGNIRELRNILQSSAVTCDAQVIADEALLQIHPELGKPSRQHQNTGADNLVSRVLDGELSMAEARRDLEYALVSQAMDRTNGNISQAARLLNMKRPRLSQMVKDFGLKEDIKKEVQL